VRFHRAHENEAAYAPRRGASKARRSFDIDSPEHRFVHGAVPDRGEMYHGVDPIEQRTPVEFASNIGDNHSLQPVWLFIGGAPDGGANGVAVRAQLAAKRGADETGSSSYKYAHSQKAGSGGLLLAIRAKRGIEGPRLQRRNIA
jgi:hypothetical protein